MSHIGAIDCQREGTLATVTLRRAVKMNAMTRAMWRDLRCVLVQGEGAYSPMAGRRNKQNLRWPPLASPGPQAYAYVGHREQPEGVMAFLEKRPAAF